MRFFGLINLQHIFLYLFPSLVFVVLLAAALYRSHFRVPDREDRMRVVHRYPAGLESMNAPFPLALVLIIAGTAVWGFFYILVHALLKVKI